MGTTYKLVEVTYDEEQEGGSMNDRWANVTFTVAVVGSKNWADADAVNEALNTFLANKMAEENAHIRLIDGGQTNGADAMARVWAADKEAVEVQSFTPRWNKHPQGAVSKRNWSMANTADAAIIFSTNHENEFVCTDLKRAFGKLSKKCYTVTTN